VSGRKGRGRREPAPHHHPHLIFRSNQFARVLETGKSRAPEPSSDPIHCLGAFPALARLRRSAQRSAEAQLGQGEITCQPTHELLSADQLTSTPLLAAIESHLFPAQPPVTRSTSPVHAPVLFLGLVTSPALPTADPAPARVLDNVHLGDAARSMVVFYTSSAVAGKPPAVIYMGKWLLR